MALEQVGGSDPLDYGAHLVGHTKDVIQVLAAELTDRNDVLAEKSALQVGGQAHRFDGVAHSAFHTHLLVFQIS